MDASNRLRLCPSGDHNSNRLRPPAASSTAAVFRAYDPAGSGTGGRSRAMRIAFTVPPPSMMIATA
jgi:hypothetical protein